MIEKPWDMKRCLICVEAVCGGYASSNKHSKYLPVVPSPTALINSSDLCLHIHIFTLIVACNNGKLMYLLVICKICTFSLSGDELYWRNIGVNVQTFYFQKSPNFQIFLSFISVSDFNWKLGQHAPHLPGGHLAVVAPRVVVPGEQGSWGREGR